jgi:hypothetical protein
MQPSLNFLQLRRRGFISACSALAGVSSMAQSAANASSSRRYGFEDGISIGVWPNAGPRGLIRLYAPHVGLAPLRVMNYVAIEPVVRGVRALPELEKSLLDGQTGTHLVVLAQRPSIWRGSVVDWEAAPEHLVKVSEAAKPFSVWIVSERMRNGAQALLRAEFDPQQPYELRLTTYACPDSAPMQRCILTATMGNYQRLRRLRFKHGVVPISRVYEAHDALDSWGFYAAKTWPAADLPQHDGAWVFAAQGDGVPLNPEAEARVPPAWRYTGQAAEQYWRVSTQAPWAAGVVARVNARRSFWPDRTGQERLIPGGASFENIELDAPFVDGQSWVYGIRRLSRST